MKKALLLFLFICCSATLFAFPPAKITLVIKMVRVGDDSVDIKEKLVFMPIKKQETPIQAVTNVGGYEIGIAVQVTGYGENKMLKKYGVRGKGWFVVQKIYYRKLGESWKLLTTDQSTMPYKANGMKMSNSFLRTDGDGINSFKIEEEVFAVKAAK
jgi:hypothetical protein